MSDSILVLGLGGGGARLAAASHAAIGGDCAVVSADSRDRVPGRVLVRVRCDALVPSVADIRAAAPMDEITSLVSGYDGVVVMANLAGRSGSALAPPVLRACRLMKKRAAAFCTMPFRYERDRVFQAALSLKRVQGDADFVVILDNDSMMECNPDMSVRDCYAAGNGALLCVAGHLDRAGAAGSGVVSAGRPRRDIVDSLRDSVKMLYETAPPSEVKSSVVYVTGGVPVGAVDSVSGLAGGIMSGAPVSVVADGSGEPGTILLSSTNRIPKFDAYDPLGVIPGDRVLDWEEPESRLGLDLHLHQME